MNSGPVAQFSPIDIRSAWRIGRQKRFGVLPGQHRAHRLDRARNHDGNFAARSSRQPLDAQQRGLHVARVLRRFDEKNIDAAVCQSLGLIVKVLLEFREGDAAA